MLSRFMPSPVKFTRAIVIAKATRILRDVCDGLGPDRIAWHIDNDTDFSHTIPRGVEVELRKSAPQWAWAAKTIADADFIAALPQWVRELVVARGDKGQAWLNRQIAWLRGLFQGG